MNSQVTSRTQAVQPMSAWRGRREKCARTHDRRAGNRMLRVCLFVTLVLFMSLAASVHAQGEKPKTIVRIGFNGSGCSHRDFIISLAGTVLTGSGTCTSDSWMNTEKGYVNLKIDETYLLTAGTDSCATHINFDIPEDYTLEIDDIEKTTITKGGETKGSGDGTWKVVLREKCSPCSGGPAGESSGPTLGSVIWGVGLGNLSDGRTAHSISLREDVLSSTIYTPAALVYSPPGLAGEVDVVRATNGSLRQIKAPQTLADVVVLSASEYDIRFYRPADVGAKVNGLYQISGQPFVTWKFKNPDTSTVSRLQIIKTQNGVPDMSEYSWDAVSGSWSLSRGNGARVETKTVAYPTSSSRAETFTVKDSNGQILSRLTRTFHTLPWGEELIQEVSDPDGAALTTLYTYYENPAELGSYGKVKTVTNPDGAWEKNVYDAFGNRTLVLRPWKDLSLAAATEANSRATYYTYSNTDGLEVSLFPRMLSSMTEKIAGVTVRKTTYARTSTSINGAPAVTETQTVYASSSVGQATTTTTYHSSAPAHLANKVASVLHADGRKDTFTYEKGNYAPAADPSLSQFTPDPNGPTERETVVHGSSGSPNGVAFKTTKETSVRDQYGHIALQEVYVYDGAAYERIAWTVLDYDERGHLTQTRRHNGQTTTCVWNADQKISEVDAAGVETIFTYDPLGRVKTETRKGVAAGGAYPAQADIVTTYTYDAEGRQTAQTVAGGGLTLSTVISNDAAGRVKTQTDQAGLVTTYTYTNGGRTQTVTFPGGATQITDKYLDGQSKSVAGTAGVAQYFDYVVNPDGTRSTQAFNGSGGQSSPRWTKVTTDWLGRLVKVERQGFAGTTSIQTSTYNNKGQLQSETVVSGSGKLLADKLYEYDEMGNQIRVGADVDASGTLTALSTDRIQETDIAFEKSGTDWFQVTTSKTYLADNNDTATVQTQRERLNNFPTNGAEKVVAEITVTDVAGNGTRTTTAVDSSAKKTTVTTDRPDTNVDAVDITVNGLLQSSTPAAPQSATTYSYDGLGRPVGVTDPRSGTTTKSYSATTGQLTSTGDGAQTVSYEYYPATHASAGRLKSQSNGGGKKVYFNYSSRGEVTQTWGDTTYPLEYVYDGYGQKTELRTFRGGQNWSASVWPASSTGTADVTKWTFQDSTGLLTQKQDAATKQVAYTYDALGRLKTRTWARASGAGGSLTTTYSYEPNTGEVTAVAYSDTTPDVTFAYDRGGRQSTITDAAGTHTRTFTAAGDLKIDQIAGGILDGAQTSAAYDGFLRRDFSQASQNSTVLVSQTYGYDAASRLETVTSSGQTATYAYHPASGLLNTTTFTGGTQTSRSFDTLGRLQSISTTTPSSGTVAGYSYTYNGLSQRTQVTREDGSYWSYSYNDRGELISGKKYWPDNTPAWGQQAEYDYDAIGNRKSVRAGGNELGQTRQSAYTANSLNQYSERTVPGAVDITGTADGAATVTVNDLAAARKGGYFYRELSVDNSASPVYLQARVVGARQNYGPGGEDAVSERGGRVFVPRAVESYGFDADGNLTSDGRWQYAWDAENRLASMEALPNVPAEARMRMEFAYDYLGRRIQKKVSVWNVQAAAYQLQSVTKFINDEWSTVAELDGNNALVRSYVWGQDASGTLQGAGGIGGLLLIREGSSTYHVAYDGNGNVGALVKAATGTASASYDYDAFGNTMRATGEYAARNPFRFSTKYTDEESGLVYYGYRYVNSQTGKWLSRDPLGEEADVNLYRYNDNDPVYYIDPLGAQVRSDRAWYPGERNPRTGRRYGDNGTFDKNSPNWAFARGPMHHTLHRVRLCIPKLDTNTALDRIYDDLRRFNHFSSPMRNVAEFTRDGDKGHFAINGAPIAFGSWFLGNSIDIIVLENAAKREVTGVTIGDHPLVGVRKWWPEKAGVMLSRSEAIVDVITEAYERASGKWNESLYSMMRTEQHEMWLMYLRNIATYWRNKHRARVIEWEKDLGTVKGTENPFRGELPAGLQNSRFTYR